MRWNYVTAMLIAAIGIGAVLPLHAEDLQEKTLVSWITVFHLGSKGGSALTLQQGEEFDGIIFAELSESKWMAGSHNYARTQQVQSYAEEESPEELIQMAIVYEKDKIIIYRNGDLLTAYEAEAIDLSRGNNQAVVFGLRHIGGDGRLEGEIEDARIYAKALSAQEIRALEPNEAGTIEPWAWWDFEGDELTDRTGRFTHGRVGGGASVSEGMLNLGEFGVAAATRNEDTMARAVLGAPALVSAEEYEPEILTMPEEVPENWLTYHLAHTGPDPAEPGDPNPMFYYKGKYHLHYIYRNKYGYCFAHVSSDDMVHWKWQPTVLAPPTTGHGMFSGTGFFTKEGKPAAIYHGEGSGKNWIVYGEDDVLDTWSKPQAIVAKSAEHPDGRIRYWDPDCWLRGNTYYALSGGRPPLLMKSNDLKEWEYLGKLFHEDTDFEKLGLDPDEDVSCANMFEIGNKWMLLCISHDLGCRYYLGDFKGDKYLPESHHLMNWKNVEYFAPESVLTPDGRRVMWTWVTGDLPLSSSQTGVQALPREISLPEDGVLRIEPLRELESLRYDKQAEKDINVEAGNSYRLKSIAGTTFELRVAVEPTDAKAYGVRVYCDDNGNGLPIRYLPDEKKLAVADVKAPFELEDGETLRLAIFLDKDMVEVFANGRQAITTGEENAWKRTGIELFSEGGTIRANARGWKMRSIYGKQLRLGNQGAVGDWPGAAAPVENAWQPLGSTDVGGLLGERLALWRNDFGIWLRMICTGSAER